MNNQEVQIAPIYTFHLVSHRFMQPKKENSEWYPATVVPCRPHAHCGAAFWKLYRIRKIEVIPLNAPVVRRTAWVERKPSNPQNTLRIPKAKLQWNPTSPVRRLTYWKVFPARGVSYPILHFSSVAPASSTQHTGMPPFHSPVR